MRKIFYIVLILTGVMLCYSKEKSIVVYPPLEKASTSLNVYPHYLFMSDSFMSDSFKTIPYPPMEYIFAPDNYICGYDHNMLDTIGIWLVRGDTLMIYQNWHKLSDGCPDEEFENMLSAEDYDIRGVVGMLHLRKVGDLSLPRNVSAFRIVNNGDSLKAINDELNTFGIPISSQSVKERHLEISSPNNPMQFIPIYWPDSLHWYPQESPRETIAVVDSIETNTAMVQRMFVYIGPLKYTILNPRHYHQSEAQVFAESAEYSTWMDSVRPGDSIALELFRPAYDAEVFERSPYLSASPDTVYVLDGDVYGYWFARPLSSK